MKLIVWGTGNLYQRYKAFFSRFELLKLCDNNLSKKGTYLDGVEIISPLQLKKYKFDYVIIMTYAVEEVCHQAEDLGIPTNKIMLYSQLWCLRESEICVHSRNTIISFEDWIVHNRKSILLISHNFCYTGVPVALKNMANVLRRMGYSVLIAAMTGGSFVKELLLEKIDYMDDLEMGYQTKYFESMLQQFLAVVIGSFDLYKMAAVIQRVKTPVIWWVHETHERYYAGKEWLPQRDGLKFYAGGNRVKKVFTSYYGGMEIQKLQYCIPDIQRNVPKKREDVSMVVAVIGTVDERKAQDIFLEAVIRMPECYRSKMKVVLLGKMDENNELFTKKIMKQKCMLNHLKWIPELTQIELEEFYSNIDVLVCPSRDDPMPIVVTQAMMHEKVCIVSENVGQAEFIEQQKNGFVFSNEGIEELSKILMWLLDNRDQCALIGKLSRNIYQEEFSEEVMRNRLSGILEELHITEDT